MCSVTKKNDFVKLVLLIVLIMPCFFFRAQNNCEMKLVSPLPTAEDLEKVIYADGYFWCVGKFGTILKSPEGINWQKLENPVISDICGIAYNGEYFIANTITGGILKSYTGNQWDVIQYDSTLVFGDIVWDGNKFIASTYYYFMYPEIFTSSEGIYWTKRYQSDPFSNAGFSLSNIAIVEGGFIVAENDYALNETNIIFSNDGIAWQKKGTIPYSYISRIVQKGSIYYACGKNPIVDEGKIYSSSDLMSWDVSFSSEKRGMFVDMVLANNTFLAVHSSQGNHTSFFKSGDGKEWQELYDEYRPSRINSLSFGGNAVTAVGSDGSIITSSNLTDFSRIYIGFNGSLSNVTYAFGKFMALGWNYDSPMNSVLVSNDGILWEEHLFDFCYGLLFLKLHFDGSRLYILDADGSIWSSNDGVNFDEAFYLENVACTFLEAATNKKGTTVFVGYEYIPKTRGIIVTTKDGIHFKKKVIKNISNIHSVTTDGKRFVALGTNSKGFLTVFVSEEGEVWERISLNYEYFPSNAMDFIRFGKNIFIFGVFPNNSLNTEYFLISKDGKEWRKEQIPYEPEEIHFADLIWTGNQFAGIAQKSGLYYFVTSSEGKQWSFSEPFTNKHLKSIVYKNSTYVTVGGWGTIFTANCTK